MINMSSKLAGVFETSESQMAATDIVKLAGVYEFFVLNVSWLLGFLETLASLVSITLIHRNFECRWQLTHSLLHGRPWFWDQVVDVSGFRTAIEDSVDFMEENKLDDYLPCRQLTIDPDYAVDYMMGSSKLSGQAELITRTLLST